ncbi:gluconokinase [Arthrobacter sp. MN05-02]|nr:gluconokinase [Arthrobacter sp. MN05-02]
MSPVKQYGPLPVVVMGVAGCGKSTIGVLLAELINGSFLDGDALHPDQNVEKMARGIPLTDADREPWLRVVGEHLASAHAPLVIACSALRRSYRNLIRESAPDTFFVHLDDDRALIADRLSNRAGHFMPPALLESQLATLEPLLPDEHGARCTNSGAPAAVAAQAAKLLSHTTISSC